MNKTKEKLGGWISAHIKSNLKLCFLLIDQNSLLPENYTEAGDLVEITCAPPDNALLTKLPLFDNLDDDPEDEAITIFCKFPQAENEPENSQFGR